MYSIIMFYWVTCHLYIYQNNNYVLNDTQGETIVPWYMISSTSKGTLEFKQKNQRNKIATAWYKASENI
jgi:hypothetical protein